MDDLPATLFMIILNEVYFKGQWVKPFEKYLTNRKPFYNFNSKINEIKVDTMMMTEHFSYFEDSNLQSIQFPFKKDSMNALIILPKLSLNINELVDLLDKDNEYIYTIYDNLKY